MAVQVNGKLHGGPAIAPVVVIFPDEGMVSPVVLPFASSMVGLRSSSSLIRRPETGGGHHAAPHEDTFLK